MSRGKTIRPSYYDEDESSQDELEYTLNKGRSNIGSESDSDVDEMSKISFGALNRAQTKLNKNNQKHKPSSWKENINNSSEEFFDSDSDSDGPPEETSSKDTKKKKNKHAPSESSSKRPVSRIRDIPGLPSRKQQTLHTDIRFDAAYGKADLIKARKDYAFLDEYRKQEIASMESLLKDKKNKLNDDEREEIKLQLQSLKSRMDTLKNRDLENNILSNYKKQQMESFKEGKVNKPYFLKRSDKRKILQKAKFDSMKPKQREKAMERKRKKRLGKEFRQLEFRPTNR
ncbi:pre-rRNA processing protein, putative [Candida dubliniensis CD36]|uniref:rRNA biogenesis protein RRP36 n=1 Tax=Candida dubliniensis (strain CD36 / ATCC MYA-646 / CBS 7987 / NCPF 3949 / NRRL Y-17841) TaxID=573826 RepID=RRP36_CANDC|nr:pre-rRNA processing protein, putative [Candida dubliniensis CD36]B9WMA4.1 RecName: Full=rRNA biogenesis protein RRP36; AltName: Full=Ribosomal RNA-processing protein 36 [Candida dubliniensis CD36]CAX40217.1 pre-rRNA processing protein, putative [Candida dubliniensis CD36]